MFLYLRGDPLVDGLPRCLGVAPGLRPEGGWAIDRTLCPISPILPPLAPGLRPGGGSGHWNKDTVSLFGALDHWLLAYAFSLINKVVPWGF